MLRLPHHPKNDNTNHYPDLTYRRGFIHNGSILINIEWFRIKLVFQFDNLSIILYWEGWKFKVEQHCEK